jgi:TPP-dependent pyruvate/acetoin dehydrogenase alpha subunit
VIDGNDPLAVIGAASDAIDRARTGRGPTFIEAKTVRLAGHYSGDAQQYRDPEELRVAWSDEPLVRLRQGADQATLDLYDTIDVEVASELQKSLEEAQRLPTPDPSTAKRHLYAE